MGKYFNENLKHKNFSFKKPSLGPSYAEERRGNLEIRRQSEPSGDLSSSGGDEGETEQDNSDQSGESPTGQSGEGLPSTGSGAKTWFKRPRNRAARRRN